MSSGFVLKNDIFRWIFALTVEYIRIIILYEVIIMHNAKRIDYTQGPILKKMLLFLLPLVATSALQQAFNTADMVIVRWFVGDTAYAAVASTGTLVSFFIELFLGFSIGANVVVARFIGERNVQSASKATHTAILLAAIGGVIIGGIGLILAEPLLRLTRVPEELMRDAALYLRIYFAGIPIYLLYNFCAAIFRSVGKNRVSLACLTVGGVLNVLFNLLLTAVIHIGVAGVALATVLANAVSLFLILFVLHRENEDIRFDFKKLKADGAILSRIIRIGLPSGLLGSIFSISNICVQTAINSLGTQMITASSSAGNIEIYVQYPGNAFAQGCTTMIGQCCGAKKWDRCKQIFYTALPVCMSVTFLISLVVYLLSGSVLRIFTTDPEILALAKERMQFTLLFKCLQCAMDISVGTMQGYGKTTVPACISLIGVCGLRLVWILTLFPLHPTVTMLFVIYPITWLIASGANLIYYYTVQKAVCRQDAVEQVKGVFV